jgi:hypothetical protein
LSDSDEYFTAEDSFQSQNDSEFFFNFYWFIFILNFDILGSICWGFHFF